MLLCDYEEGTKMKRRGLFDFGFNDLNRDGNISSMEAAFGMQVMDEADDNDDDGDDFDSDDVCFDDDD